VVWVDVFVPAGAGVANHTAAVAVNHFGGRINLRVDIEVLPFTLPSTPSMRSIFGFGGSARLVDAHKLDDPTGPHAMALVRRCVRDISSSCSFESHSCATSLVSLCTRSCQHLQARIAALIALLRVHQ
jgi:hypothetical protein